MARKQRNKIPKTQRVLSGIVVDPINYEKPRIIELVEYVKHQDSLHLFEESSTIVFENEVIEFYYTIEFLEDRISLSSQVQGKPMYLDEYALGKILDVPVTIVRTIVKQLPTTE